MGGPSKKTRPIICKNCSVLFFGEERFKNKKFCSVLCFKKFIQSTKATVEEKRIKQRNRQRDYYATENGRRIVKRISANSRQKNYVKYYARILLNRAVNSGRVEKPILCSCCKKHHDYIQAHHENYDFPLCVTWLCAPCHKKKHRDVK